MTDIFLSYSRRDRAIARQLVAAFEAQGWVVWWDLDGLRDGERFSEVIGERLSSARCVVVVWSGASVASRWVNDEAEFALDQGKAIPLMIEAVEMPWRFRTLHASDLSGWGGDASDPRLARLIDSLAVRLPGRVEGRPGADRDATRHVTGTPEPTRADGAAGAENVAVMARDLHPAGARPEPVAGAAGASKVLLLSCVALGLSVGALSSFGVLAAPLVAEIGLSRTVVGTSSAVALVSMILAMLLGHTLHGRLAPHWMSAGIGVLAASALLACALATGPVLLYIGRGVMGGVAIGLGYGLVLQLVGQAGVRRRGVALGIVVAAVASSDLVFTPMFSLYSQQLGVRPGIAMGAISVVALAALASFGLRISGTRWPRGRSRDAAPGSTALTVRLWLVFCLASGATAVVVTHGAAMALDRGIAPGGLAAIVAAMGLGQILGSVGGGWVSDRDPSRRALGLAPGLAGVAALGLMWVEDPTAVAAFTGALGVSSGALSVMIPAAVFQRVAPGAAARTFGWIFSGRGVALLAVPLFAGFLFDASGTYDTALWLSVALAVAALVAIATLPPVDAGQTSGVSPSA